MSSVATGLGLWEVGFQYISFANAILLYSISTIEPSPNVKSLLIWVRFGYNSLAFCSEAKASMKGLYSCIWSCSIGVKATNFLTDLLFEANSEVVLMRFNFDEVFL